MEDPRILASSTPPASKASAQWQTTRSCS
jgi:hypothetical protein